FASHELLVSESSEGAAIDTFPFGRFPQTLFHAGESFRIPVEPQFGAGLGGFQEQFEFGTSDGGVRPHDRRLRLRGKCVKWDAPTQGEMGAQFRGERSRIPCPKIGIWGVRQTNPTRSATPSAAQNPS